MLEVMEIRSEEWHIASVLGKPEQVFALWLVQKAFCLQREDFVTHFEDDVQIFEIIDGLVRDQLIADNEGKLDLTIAGKTVLERLSRSPGDMVEHMPAIKRYWRLPQTPNAQLTSFSSGRAAAETIIALAFARQPVETVLLRETGPQFLDIPPCQTSFGGLALSQEADHLAVISQNTFDSSLNIFRREGSQFTLVVRAELAEEGVAERIIITPRTGLAICGMDDGHLAIWSVSGARLLSLPKDRSIHDAHVLQIGDGPDQSSVRVSDVHDGAIKLMSASPDGRHLATADNRGKVIIWNIENLLTFGVPRIDNTTIVSNATSYITTLAFSQDGRLLAIGFGDGRLEVWDINNTAQPQARFGEKVHARAIQFTAFLPNDHVITASLTGTISMHNIQNQRRQWRVPLVSDQTDLIGDLIVSDIIGIPTTLLVRTEDIRTHISTLYLLSALNSDQPVRKKLDFVPQEQGALTLPMGVFAMSLTPMSDPPGTRSYLCLASTTGIELCTIEWS
jgi:hypothetical protein